MKSRYLDAVIAANAEGRSVALATELKSGAQLYLDGDEFAGDLALDEDLDLAAAGEPDLPGLLVADPEIEEARLAVLDRRLCFLDDDTLDTAARDRADKRAVIGDRELGARRAR